MIEILTSILTTAVLWAILTFCLKNWLKERLKQSIKAEYETALAAHKENLRGETEKALGQLKTQQQLYLNDHSIRLSRVFEKTVETAANIYERLVELQDALGAYVKMIEWKSDPSKAERRAKVVERYEALVSSFKPRRPFLPKNVVEHLNSIMKAVNETAVKFKESAEDGGEHRAYQRGEEPLNPWLEADDSMVVIGNLIVELEDQLRIILVTGELEPLK